MDEIAGSAAEDDEIPARQRIAALEHENQRLKDLVASLQASSLADTRMPSAAALQHQLQQVREANQHLVLATFGAQDSQTAAEAAHRHQTIFLSMLAHELRNPLAPIAAANSVLEALDIPHPLLPKLTAILRRQVNHLVHLVDDLLDGSRIASGKISLQKSAVSLLEVIESAIETAQPSYDGRSQHVHIRGPLPPVVLWADLVRLAQLFSNLLINASKFSAADTTVWVSASVRDDMLTVSVKDDGAGIPHDLQPHIFELFTQGDQPLDRNSGGLGIGLSLVRTLAELHGGTVTVNSDGAGCGSEFLVALPIGPQPPAAPGATAPAGRTCEMRA